MSKIEVNNEIVLMRQHVRRARVYIVRRLIKQIKMFGSRKGDDKQREKYKRKADKLREELIAIKKIKEDEISRYSITNQRKLEEILRRQESDPETCVLARISTHKIMADRVAEFKKKFPNFEEHLGPGRRKLMKMKRKAGKQAKKNAKVTAELSVPEEAGKEESGIETKDENESGDSGEEVDESLVKMEENMETELPERTINTKRKAESSSSESKSVKTKPEISPGVKPRETKARKAEKKVDELTTMTSTNRESAVKSFARFLEEKEAQNPAARESGNEEIAKEGEIELEKEVDSFFMTEDGGGEYLSVVVPKSKLTENEEGVEEQNSFRSRNNRFFDKVDERVDKHSHRRDNNNFGKGDRLKTGRNGPRDKNMRGNFKSVEKPSSESMHPSWAAKKKQQEISKLGFQGKKIVFDDV